MQTLFFTVMQECEMPIKQGFMKDGEHQIGTEGSNPSLSAIEILGNFRAMRERRNELRVGIRQRHAPAAVFTFQRNQWRKVIVHPSEIFSISVTFSRSCRTIVNSATLKFPPAGSGLRGPGALPR